METCPDCWIWRWATQMVAHDVAFWHDDGVTIQLCLNMNDVFTYAADAEPVPWEDIPAVFKLWQGKGGEGLVQWVAEKRGVQPLPERNK